MDKVILADPGHTLDEFLDDFPTVDKADAIAALEQAKDLVLAQF